MSKLTIQAPSTFRAKVHIPGAGDDSITIEFVYRHMRKSAFQSFLDDQAKNLEDPDAIMFIAQGWDREGIEFTRDNVVALIEDYHLAPRLVVETFIVELTGVAHFTRMQAKRAA
jgi:hypothetical protein